jgi:hypothetical protein
MSSYKYVLVPLTRPEINHLLTLLRDNESEGSYYGNREQYENRSERIRCALKGWMDHRAVSSGGHKQGVRMPACGVCHIPVDRCQCLMDKEPRP